MIPPRAISIGYWQNQSANDVWTRTEVEDLTTRYQLFMTRYDPQVSWIKSVAPHRTIKYYRNFEAVYYHSSPEAGKPTPQSWLDGGSVGTPPEPWNEFTDFVNNGAVLVNSSGNYLVNKGFPNERMVDPANPWYRHYLRELLKYKINLGYDYIFADCLRAWVDAMPWHYAEYPINPRTGSLYADDDWAADVRDLVDYVKSGTGIIIVANGIPQADGSWGYYSKRRDLTDLLIEKVDGQMIEGPWGWNTTDFGSRGQTTYKQNLDLLKLLMRPDKISELHNPNLGIENRLFSFCSHMLIVEPGCPLTVKYGSWSQTESSEWLAITGYDYGEPLEDYQENGSLFTRRFTRALISVDYATRAASIVHLEPVIVELSYHSIPPGISASLEGSVLGDGEIVSLEQGGVYRLNVPKRVEL